MRMPDHVRPPSVYTKMATVGDLSASVLTDVLFEIGNGSEPTPDPTP